MTERNGGTSLVYIRVRKNRINIVGHAGYAEAGKDIVCAGISTLSQNLVAGLEELTEDKINTISEPGWLEIIYRDLSKEGELLIDSFFIGINMIANEYPNNVRVM